MNSRFLVGNEKNTEIESNQLEMFTAIEHYHNIEFQV